YLGQKDLTSPLPDFRSMDALEIIDLHGNGLIGAIPSFLSEFPKLKVLNLANNRFSGLIPDSLACNNNLELSLAGNTDLHTSNSCTTSKTESLPPPTRTNPNTPSDGTFESPRTNPVAPSGGTFESPRTIPGTPSGGTFESPRTIPGTPSGVTVESPQKNTDTRTNIRKTKKNKLSLILGSTGSGVVVSCIIGAILAIFRRREDAAEVA
ncbi:receptor-like protein 51, partial [Olea europaea var. sylvestris]|uniref:receptor-like protein 51 n=1 Tax=Olea europaea var. sylvestris TaxID=158386 RepID=UPI000C1D889D